MAQRKLNPEELAGLQAEGYDITPFVDKVIDVPDEQFSAGQAFGRNLATSALPTAASGAGFAAGANPA